MSGNLCKGCFRRKGGSPGGEECSRERGRPRGPEPQTPLCGPPRPGPPRHEPSPVPTLLGAQPALSGGDSPASGMEPQAHSSQWDVSCGPPAPHGMAAAGGWTPLSGCEPTPCPRPQPPPVPAPRRSISHWHPEAHMAHLCCDLDSAQASQAAPTTTTLPSPQGPEAGSWRRGPACLQTQMAVRAEGALEGGGSSWGPRIPVRSSSLL